MNKIAGGEEGNVYLLKNKKIIKHRKINTDDKEFRIQQILYQIIPDHIVRPIDQFRTLNGKPIFLMDYLNAKTFKEIAKEPENYENFPDIITSLLCKVMRALDKVHRVYPTFRHNDLHSENVMITENQEVFLMDFGKARMDLPGVNHMSIYNNYGIVPHNDIRYDYHFFINNVYIHAPPDSKVKKMIEIVMPSEYLGSESAVIKNYRLRSGMEHPKLPSRSKLVKIFCVK